jgi:hypothetical protein
LEAEARLCLNPAKAFQTRSHPPVS